MGRKFPFFLFGNVTPVQPTLTGLTADFDSAKNVLTSGGKATSITDVNQGLEYVQADSSHQATYDATGGPDGMPCLTGTNWFMGGNAMQGGIVFFTIALYWVNDLTHANQCPLYNGSQTPGFTGYGLQGVGGDPHKNSGLYFQGVADVPFPDTGTSTGRWVVAAGSRGAAGTKWYNACGVEHIFTSPPTPADPVGTTGFIGNIPLQPNFYGKFRRAQMGNVQLSYADAKAQINFYYKTYKYPMPVNTIYNGDSITHGFGSSYSFPLQTYQQLLDSNNKYTACSNFAVDGVDSAYVLANISQVTNAYNTNATNVYFLMIGHNDIENGLGPIPLIQYQANINGTLAAVNASGTWIIVLSTIILSSQEVSNPTTMALLLAYNTWLRSLAGGNIHVIDSYAIPQFADPSNMTYFQADGIHLTTSGDTIEANNLSVFMNGLF